MSTIYFTITGIKYYFGDEFLTPGMEVRLVKEPDHKIDSEAIRVELDGLGKIGYVANSPYTVLGESYSAGRLYDRMGDTATGTVLYRLTNGILCTLNDPLPVPDQPEDELPSPDTPEHKKTDPQKA